MNIARFSLPKEHPNNVEFVNSLERVNKVAETQPGFVWRFTGEGNDALDIQAFEDPNIAVNMSIWTDLDSLGAFVYRNHDHLAIMRRRKEWFDHIEFRLVLWWVEEGHIPSMDEATHRLDLLTHNGPCREAFTFKQPFPPLRGKEIPPILDECA